MIRTSILSIENGSNAVINYFANGSKSYSKERLEVYSQGRTLIMDNFRTTKGYGFKGFRKLKTKMNKGHLSQFENYLTSVTEGKEALISFESLMNTSRASIAAIESLKTKGWVAV